MGYDIQLERDGETVHFSENHQIAGGTYAIGGTTEAWMSVTYNYAPFYYRVFGEGGIRTIYGMTPADSIPVLRDAMGKLGTDATNNYWDATEGNAARALQGLIDIAQIAVQEAPDAIWAGD